MTAAQGLGQVCLRRLPRIPMNELEHDCIRFVADAQSMRLPYRNPTSNHRKGDGRFVGQAHHLVRQRHQHRHEHGRLRMCVRYRMNHMEPCGGSIPLHDT